MTSMEPITLELDYQLWRCGGIADPGTQPKGCALGKGTTELMRCTPPTPHSCCCVGLMLRAAGVPEASLVGAGTVGAVSNGDASRAPELVRRLALYIDEPSRTKVADRAYRINDASDVPIVERMAQITQLFAAYAIVLRWINVPEEMQESFDFYVTQKDGTITT